MKPSNKAVKNTALLLVLLLTAFLAAKDFLFSYELPLLDWRFHLRPQEKETAPLAIVEIDNRTLSAFGRWPLKRNLYILALAALKEFGAEAAVFDIFFSEKTPYDQALALAMKSYLPVYLPLAFQLEGKSNLPKASKIIAQEEELFLASSAGKGHINTFVDKDGKIRRLPLFIKFKQKLIPQISLAAFCHLKQLDCRKVKIYRQKIAVGKNLVIPLDRQGRFLVNYAGKWGVFLHYSFLDILKSYQRKISGQKVPAKFKKLKGRICFLGLTASGTSDIRAVPLEENYPQVGVLANVFNSLWQRKFIYDEPQALKIILTLALALLAVFLAQKFPVRKAVLIWLGVFFGYNLAAVLAFCFFGFWLRMFMPSFAFFVFYLSGVVIRVSREIKRRQMLEKELEVARNIQNSFLPKSKDIPPYLDLEPFFKPARFVAGDLYDLCKISEQKYGVFIADVSGKGVPAALIMAQTVTLFRLLAEEFRPAEVLNRINRQLCGFLKGKFVTALYLVYNSESKTVEVASAGHTPLGIWQAEKRKFTFIDPEAGPPLGILSLVNYTNYTLKVGPEDIIVLYTDGVTEARNNKGDDFGEKRLEKLIEKENAIILSDLKNKLAEEISLFSRGCKQHDDITFILIKFTKRGMI